MDNDIGAIGSCRVVLFDIPDDHGGNKNGRSDDSIHVERLKSEHLLNTIPGNEFAFGRDDAEIDSYQQIGPEKELFGAHGGLIHVVPLRLKDEWENEVGHGKSPDEEPDHSD